MRVGLIWTWSRFNVRTVLWLKNINIFLIIIFAIWAWYIYKVDFINCYCLLQSFIDLVKWRGFWLYISCFLSFRWVIMSIWLSLLFSDSSVWLLCKKQINCTVMLLDRIIPSSEPELKNSLQCFVIHAETIFCQLSPQEWKDMFAFSV